MWTLPSPELAAADKTTAVAYSPNGATLAVGGQDVQLWNAASRTHVATHPLAAGMFVNGLAFSPDGRILAAAYSDHTVGLLNASTLAPLGAPFQVTAAGNAETVAFSPDGTVLATGGDDGTVRLWSVTDPAHPSQLSSVHDSGTYVFTVVFSPDGKTLAAASTDNLTRLWDVANPARPAQLGKPLGGFSSYAIGLAFTPDGKLLAVGSADKTIRLWSIANPARPVQVGAPLTGPAGYVWAAGVQPGRHDAGGRRHRRHRLAVAGHRPGQPVADRDPHRPRGACLLGRVRPVRRRSSRRPATTAPSTCGTSAPGRRSRRSAPTSASRSPAPSGTSTCPACRTARRARNTGRNLVLGAGRYGRRIAARSDRQQCRREGVEPELGHDLTAAGIAGR